MHIPIASAGTTFPHLRIPGMRSLPHEHHLLLGQMPWQAVGSCKGSACEPAQYILLRCTTARLRAPTEYPVAIPRGLEQASSISRTSRPRGGMGPTAGSPRGYGVHVAEWFCVKWEGGVSSLNPSSSQALRASWLQPRGGRIRLEMLD